MCLKIKKCFYLKDILSILTNKKFYKKYLDLTEIMPKIMLFTKSIYCLLDFLKFGNTANNT